MSRLKNKVVLISGASAGIGLAAAEAFAAEGCRLVLGARRLEKLHAVASAISAAHPAEVKAVSLDVTEEQSCDAFVSEALQAFGQVDVLVNNAGLARGTDTVMNQSSDDVREMFETNVFGLLTLTRKVLKPMLAADSGHIINLGSVAGHLAYEGGSAYCATKHSERVISEVLRLELLGKNIRVSSIDPGLVETEFSTVRFRGDGEKAKNVYAGMTPLTAADIAECIVFAASRPPHVDIDTLVVRPLDQAGTKVFRRP
ncbi:MAG: SDR family NAD(P)-dependent oxidoreductase [Rhizobacter sp.]|nr:SDR family NAD(P)-dependent oxidoreductase [Chlorobiales bacterium]